MRWRRLGRSSVEVTELGFGGGPLGGLFAPVTDQAAREALAAAWDGGIRYFDTAPHYGIGHSERRIGQFLRRQLRAAFTLSTKVGRLLVPQDPAGRTDESFEVPATHRRVWDFSRDGIRRSVEESLARMGMDRVEVLLLHDAEDHFQAALHQGYPALAELRAQGVVGAIGAGMYHTAKLTRLVRETDVDVVMLVATRCWRSAPWTTCCPPAPNAACRCWPPRCSTRGCWPCRDPLIGPGLTMRPPRRGCCSGRTASPRSARRTA